MPVLTGYCGSPLPVEEQIAWLARLRSLVLRLDAEAGLEELVSEDPASYRTTVDRAMRRKSGDIAQQTEDFLSELAYTGLSHHSTDSYRLTLKRFFAFCAERGIDHYRLTGPQAREFRNLLVGRGLGPSTVNCHLSHVKRFYEYLVEEELVGGNPVIRRRLRVKEPVRLPKFLFPDEKQQILDWFADTPEPVGLAFRTLFASGLRLGELVALGPGDLLVRGNAYLLHVRLGEGAKGRLAPVVDREVAFELARYTRDRIEADTLFGVTATFLANYARRCGEETGIPFHAHRCRHTFATELLRSGVALDVVQEALGHADIDTTRTYARTAPQALLRLGFHER